MKKMLITCLLTFSLAPFGYSQNNPYQNTNLTAEQRAEDLLQRLTLEEKISLMQNASPAIPRLGIKAYDWWSEALHGVARAGNATVFPQTIGMAASFDDGLLSQVFTAVSDEARVKHHLTIKNNGARYQGLTMWTPNINIFRDPRWGRGQETYGEDPYLTSRMGVTVIKALQGTNDAKYDKLHACAKHFAVHSGPEWNRHSFDAENISPRDLWETYLPAFKVAVQEGNVKEVMCAYNRYEGEPCCGSNRLLTQILRDEWGYKGIVVSDCGAISDFWQENKHETQPDAVHASANAVLSGTDLECGSNYKSLAEAVKGGLIDENQINTSLKRLLTARYKLGEMDDETKIWTQLPDNIINCPAHKQLALQMAHKTMVLLQNRNQILPLNGQMKIALIGPNANDSVMQWANYNGIPYHTITLLEAMKKELPKANLIYEPVCDFTEDALFVSRFNQCRTTQGTGFHATYWNNNTFEGDKAADEQQTTPFKFNTDGGITFASGVNLRGFCADYQTVYNAENKEDVELRIRLRGVCELYINGKLIKVFEQPIKQMSPIYTLKTEAGKKYDIRLKYKNERGTGTLYFDLGVKQKIDMAKVIDKLQNVDVVVFAGGISAALEGEEMPVNAPGFKGGDRTDIELPAVQRNVMAALKKAGKKIVFVNFSGSAMALCPESTNCDAILQAWYPGESGGHAVADVLFGKYNPGGKLPVTFYKSIKQLPDFMDYSMKGHTYRYLKEEPLFPFGYGLSYTTFIFGKANPDKTQLLPNETLTLQIPVSNKGKRDGEEVVQIYLRHPDDTEGPIKNLRAFKRISIPQGETKTVKIEIPYKDFEWFDTTTNTMRPLNGNYEILYGSSSRDQDLQTITIQLK